MSDKIKTLSQAIRLGATFRPQCFRQLSDGIGTCALGAALEAVYGEEAEGDLPGKLLDRFPQLSNGVSWFGVSGSVQGLILHMNDIRKMSREAIADVLEAHGL